MEVSDSAGLLTHVQLTSELKFFPMLHHAASNSDVSMLLLKRAADLPTCCIGAVDPIQDVDFSALATLPPPGSPGSKST